jgi:surfeit locus 1 family protein
MSAFRKLFWPSFATLIALGILLSLGAWQLRRMHEKAAQLDQLRHATTGAAKPLDGQDLLAISIHGAGFPSIGYTELAELSRVSLSGVYMAASSVAVRVTLPATKDSPISGIGFFLMSPLRTTDGTIVFVNRGFASAAGPNWTPPPMRTPAGQQTVVGLVRKPEKRSWFMPADDWAKGEYFARDPQLLAQAMVLPAGKVATFFIDAERQAGDLTPPVGVDPREMIRRIPNNHLQYAVTWFGLALTLVGVFAFFARARLRETA